MSTNIINITNTLTNIINMPAEVTNTVLRVAEMPSKAWWEIALMIGGPALTALSALFMWRSVEEMKRQRELSEKQYQESIRKNDILKIQEFIKKSVRPEQNRFDSTDFSVIELTQIKFPTTNYQGKQVGALFPSAKNTEDLIFATRNTQLQLSNHAFIQYFSHALKILDEIASGFRVYEILYSDPEFEADLKEFDILSFVHKYDYLLHLLSDINNYFQDFSKLMEALHDITNYQPKDTQ